MAARYFPVYPTNVPVDDSIKAFIFNFYSTSDTRGATESWVNFFTDDATVTIGNDSATGKEDVFRLREGMWTKVEDRKHSLDKVFLGSYASGKNGSEGEATEFMLNGTVNYRLKTGEEDSADWAGLARLRRSEDGAWKFAYYRVYIQR